MVRLNRRLAEEMSRSGNDRWDVTVVAPKFVKGDLRPIPLEAGVGAGERLESTNLYLSGKPHVMLYGRQLRSLLREPWDLVHVWEEPYVLAGAQILRWARPAPAVFYSFQNLHKRYPPPFAQVERYSVQRCTGWIAAGHTVKETLTQRPGYAAKPHEVIWLGVDTDRFRPDAAARNAIRQQLTWSAAGPPVVGYLGRFIPEKGLARLRDALDATRSPWRALFVGGGPEEASLQTWAKKHPENVRIVTGVPHDGVPAYLAAMDILAAPSQTTTHWREQLGRMLIEGFATGLAVMGSDSGEIPHVIGDAGLVLPEADTPAWTDALERLLTDTAYRQELGQRGRARALESFNWPVIATQHLRFFEQLCDTPKA